MPIVKKGEETKVENCRGVLLTPTLYKVYASVLANRLREEVEEKGSHFTESNGIQKGSRDDEQCICAELFH